MKLLSKLTLALVMCGSIFMQNMHAGNSGNPGNTSSKWSALRGHTIKWSGVVQQWLIEIFKKKQPTYRVPQHRFVPEEKESPLSFLNGWYRFLWWKKDYQGKN